MTTVTTTPTPAVPTPVNALETAVKNYVANPKAGFKTTELWLSVLALIDSMVLAKWHTNLHLTSSDAVIASVGNGVIAAAYTAGRTWLKGKHL